MQPLEVTLFGGFALRRGSEMVPPIASRVGRSLFAYLAVHQGVALPRERLVHEFWPELSESRGRRRLSHTLWQLQDALSELPGDASYLDVGTDTLAFGTSAPVAVDVREFERGLDELRHLRTATEVRSRDLLRLERVVELYRGDLLDGHYEPWVITEQERLAQRYLEALTTLVDMAKRLGVYDDALVYARRITHQDPLREDAHREVMRLSMLLGRPSEALRQYERCREVLAEELGADPSPATADLHERILRQGRGDVVAAAEPEPFPQRIPLIGRDQERSAALEVVDAAVAGRGGAVLVEGDPGLGKSRLLEEIIDDAGWRGFAVTAARATDAGRVGPFALVRQLIATTLTPLRLEHLRHRVEPVWLAEVARLVPAISRAVPDLPPGERRLHGDEGAQRMRDAAVRVLHALTDIDPLLIVADDVHAVDPDSLAVLTDLAMELEEHRGVLLLAYRAEDARLRPDVWAAIQGIDRQLRPARLVLGPLDVFSIGELTRVVARGQRIDPAAAARLGQETGGNPLFVVETLRELADQGQLTALEEDAAQLPLPGSIRELVVARTTRLSEEARTVLDLVAVAGEGVDLDTLESASELPRAAVVDGVDLLLRRTLVREAADGYATHHDQIRRTCLDVIRGDTRASLHRRLAEALEQHHPDAVERLAAHYESAGLGRRAVGYLLAAGRRAVGLHAYAAARAWFTRAADLQRRGPFRVEARFALLGELQEVLDVLGEREEQQAVLEQLAELAGGEPAMVAEVARLRALLRAGRGEPDAATAEADHAVALAADLDDPALTSRALRAAASVRTWAGRHGDALAWWDRAIAAADDPVAVAEARTMRASVLRELHRYDDAARELETALEVAAAAGELREEARALGVLGAVRMELGDSAAAVELYRASLERCERIGLRRGQRINLTNLGNVLYARGELVAALDAYQRAAEIAQSMGDLAGAAAAQLNLGVVRHLVLGQDDLARRDLEAALTHFEAYDGSRFAVACHEALASIAQRAGDLSLAERHLAAGEAMVAASDDAWSVVPLALRRAALTLERGDAQAARAAAEQAVATARAYELRDLLPGALAMLARAHLALGQADAAEQVTDQAVAALDGGVERPYLIHLVRHDALVAVGREAEARQAAAAGAAGLEATLAGVEGADGQRAHAIPEHARLIALATEVLPRRIHIEVARQDAPTGRALAGAELLEVEITLDPTEAPADPVERRRHHLQAAVAQVGAQGGATTVADLARVLEVSEATVRRDLAALRAQGVSVVTRGSRTG